MSVLASLHSNLVNRFLLELLSLALNLIKLFLHPSSICIAEKITDLDPENSGAYMQLSSMLATSGDWERSAQIRKMMRDMRIQKNPGCSWAEC